MATHRRKEEIDGGAEEEVNDRPRDRARAFCDQYGVECPILLAPMAGACPVSLSVAVANAGGMGALGALVTTPSGITDWVRAFNGAVTRARCRSTTGSRIRRRVVTRTPKRACAPSSRRGGQLFRPRPGT